MAVEKSTIGYMFTSSRKRTLIKALGASMLAVAAIGSTGCTLTSGVCRVFTQSDCIDNCMINYRNRVLAARAWHERSHCYANHRFKSDFEAGFLKGYADVAKGGDGCTPPIAPSEYLGWRYQSSDGQAAINAWFQGYPLGAQAAEQDGVGSWGDIRPSQSQRPREAVFVPPGSRRGTEQQEQVNPFYENSEPYPYEPGPPVPPTPDDANDGEDAAESPLDDSIREALGGSGPDADVMELEDSGPFDSQGEDVGDAIRDALDSATPSEADSTSTPYGGVPQASATVGDSSPVFKGEQDGLNFTIEDIDDDSVSKIFSDSSASASPPAVDISAPATAQPQAETAKAPVLDDIPFSFE